MNATTTRPANVWTVGQVVGKKSGFANLLIFKGSVVAVTKGGRATVNFSRPDGGMFRSEFTAAGRPYPYTRGGGSLFAWNAREHEPAWRKRLDEHAARMASVQASRDEAKREQAQRRDVIGWALEVLSRQNDARGPAAIKLIEDQLMPAPAEEGTES